MPENAEATGQAATGNLADELAAAREELRKEKEKHLMASNLARNKQQEAENYKRQLESQTRREPQRGYEDQETANLRDEVRRLRDEQHLTRFKLEHPDADMTELQAIYEDPFQRESIISYNADGTPNVYVTLKTSYREKKARLADEMKAAAQAAKASQNDEQNRQKAQATISGGGGSAPQETINLDDISSDEMLRRGMVQGAEGVEPLFRKT